jgi:PKD repeat protein
VASFTASPTSGAEPLPVTFTDTSTGTAPITRYWDLGDGTKVTNVTGTGDSFVHNYAAGTYTVSLLASNASGWNTVTDVNLISVTTVFQAWLNHYGLTGANALGTADPDGDGVNNNNEFLSGFSPINASAYAHVISIVRSNSDMRVTFLGANGDNTWTPGIASRTNVLEFTTGTPPNGNYTNNFVSTGVSMILSGGNGLGTNVTAVDVGGAIGATRYYRIRVIAP